MPIKKNTTEVEGLSCQTKAQMGVNWAIITIWSLWLVVQRHGALGVLTEAMELPLNCNGSENTEHFTNAYACFRIGTLCAPKKPS